MTSRYIFFIILVSCVSCTSIKDPSKLTHADSLEVLELALKSRYLSKDYKSYAPYNPVIYLVLNSVQKKQQWPSLMSGIKIDTIGNFNVKRNHLEQANDRRFSIAVKKMDLRNDSLDVTIYNYKYYTKYKYKLVKQNGKWIIVSERAFIE